jgi:hypothetical protein
MSTTRKTPKTALPKPAALLRAYLLSHADEREVGTVEQPCPYVSTNGRVYVHSRHLLAWARGEYGEEVSQRDVQAALRSLGMSVRAMALPGLGKSAGFYTAASVKGLSLRSVPIRLRPRAKASA